MSFHYRPDQNVRKQGVRARPKCRRGHIQTGVNNAVAENRSPVCRACQNAHRWAKKNHLFYDDPKVEARADALYAEYMRGEAK